MNSSLKALEIESNNISNVNTTAFKYSRVNFEDMMADSRMRFGVQSDNLQTVFSQGDLKVTENTYDMALSGDSFFIVDAQLPKEQNLEDNKTKAYTRAGNFKISGNTYVDKKTVDVGSAGYLVTQRDANVYGWNPTIVSQPQNMMFEEEYNDLVFNNITRENNISTTTVIKKTVYDLAKVQEMIDANAALDRYIKDPTETNYSDASKKVGLAGAKMLKMDITVDTNKQDLSPIDTDLNRLKISKTLLNMPEDKMINQYTNNDFEVLESGEIMLKQDGVNMIVGQLALAKFINNDGLKQVDGELFMVQQNQDGTAPISGDPKITAGNNNHAMVIGQSLEMSNATLTDTLTNLLVFQRAFESNAKANTTSQEILENIIQMKR
jgi:flagellar hook-basal body protein